MTQSFKTKRLVESALMIALSTILSFIIIFRLPFGGSITACCMLPVILAAYRYGTKWGLVTAFAFSLIQGIQGIAEGTFSAASLGVENGVFNGGFFRAARCWPPSASSCWTTSSPSPCWASAASSATGSKINSCRWSAASWLLACSAISRTSSPAPSSLASGASGSSPRRASSHGARRWSICSRVSRCTSSTR